MSLILFLFLFNKIQLPNLTLQTQKATLKNLSH